MEKTKSIGLITLLVLIFVSGCVKKEVPGVVPGADRTEVYLPMLAGKSVALAVNNSSVIDGKPILDTLLSLGVKVVRIFSPEHGFRGGNQYDTVDIKTGVPIALLYGSDSYKPKNEDLANVDVVVFDMQDVGTRFYTYLSTLHYVMEACAENGKDLIILDRPNPNDYYVDGPVLDTAFRSFVGMHPIPILHGLTLGEYAGMVNGEKWLKGGVQCKIEVVKVDGYSHGSEYILPIPPSPNLNTQQSILLYPSLCLFEGTVISQGRGTMFPFQVLGNPELKEKYQFSFTPVSIEGMSTNPPHKDKECFGLDLREFNTGIFKETKRINLEWLIELYNAYPVKEEFFKEGRFDRLAGTDTLRKQIIEGKSIHEIRESWEPALSNYKEIRKKYLIYGDTE
ncbi:MAG: exo-beta-N-acetylmuramidase NamZ domain-containing protein [Bacteroidales bacterium]